MKIVTGNLIEMAQDGQFDIIIHGCNCFNTMGKGIAPLIKKAFPEAYDADQATTKGDKAKLGNLSYGIGKVKNNASVVVVNAYTQYAFWRVGDKNVRHCDYPAVERVFQRIASKAANLFSHIPLNQIKIGYPLIGCGLAGGDWNVVRPIIDRALEGFDHTLVILPK